MKLLFMPCIDLEKAEALYHRHRLGHCTTVLHGVAVRCSRIFHRLFLCVTICKFTSCILINWATKPKRTGQA